MSTPKDKALTRVEQAPAPLVSDERIIETSDRIYPIPSGLDPEDEEESEMIERIKCDQLLVRRGMREARIIYESELTKMRAERDELVGALRRMRKPFRVINKEWALDWGPVNGACRHTDRVLSKYKTE